MSNVVFRSWSSQSSTPDGFQKFWKIELDEVPNFSTSKSIVYARLCCAGTLFVPKRCFVEKKTTQIYLVTSVACAQGYTDQKSTFTCRRGNGSSLRNFNLNFRLGLETLHDELKKALATGGDESVGGHPSQPTLVKDSWKATLPDSRPFPTGPPPPSPLGPLLFPGHNLCMERRRGVGGHHRSSSFPFSPWRRLTETRNGVGVGGQGEGHRRNRRYLGL